MSDEIPTTDNPAPELSPDDEDSEEVYHPDVEELLAPQETTVGYRIGTLILMAAIVLVTLFLAFYTAIQLF